MEEYHSKDFINALNKKCKEEQLVCPYCKGDTFTTIQDFASITVGKNLSSFNLCTSIPAGMIICQNCGHIDFFSLGILGLFKTNKEKNNIEQDLVKGGNNGK